MSRIRFGAVLLTLMLASGFASATDKTVDPNLVSGFLGDYSQLRPVPNREGVMAYVDKSADFHGYTKVMFDPIEVFLNPNPAYKGVNPDALKRMTDSFLAAFTNALTPGYEIVTTPGPDVLRVRAAITGVDLVKTPTTATDFIPIKALFNLGRAAAGDSPRLVQMSAEMEVVDDKGTRLAAMTATRKGEKTLPQDAKITWADMDAIVAYWAKSFRQRLDQLRGVTATP